MLQSLKYLLEPAQDHQKLCQAWVDGAEKPEFTRVNEDFEHRPTENGSYAVDLEQVRTISNLNKKVARHCLKMILEYEKLSTSEHYEPAQIKPLQPWFLKGVFISRPKFILLPLWK